jgi:Domain of unknown function (DUF4868)
VIDSPQCSAEFFFVLKEEGDTLTVKRPDMNQDVQTELGEQFMASLRIQVSDREEITLVDLTNADGRNNVIYRYDLDDVPAQLQALEEMIAGEVFAAFDFENDSLKNLEGILILLGDHERQVGLYKHHYPVTLMQKNNGIIARVKGSSRFEKLDQDILKINPSFDFFIFEDQFYILEMKTLERFCGFQEAIKNVATQAIAIVTQSALIVDTAVLTARLDDMAFCRKLANLTKNSPVLGIIPNADIIAFVTGHPKLARKFSLNDAQTQFHLKTKVSQTLFLKLLNDDYLKSLLTQNDYDSLAKDSLLPEPEAV